MAMVVQHNLTAMNSNRMLGVNTATQAKSTEKLSSGYKINRAADDAAGLSISEKMRKQMRGLTQASLNAEDGISAVQTAEGALNEVQDMLQRMNELAVKSANGTMSEDDRSYIQNEIDQLVTEIDRVSTTTKFNETYLLQGDAVGKVTTEDGKGLTAQNVGGLTGLNLVAAEGSELKAGTVELGTIGTNTEVTAGDATASLDEASLGGALKTALNESDEGTAVVKWVAAKADTDASDDIDDSVAGYWQIGATEDTVAGNYTTAQLGSMGLTVGLEDEAATDAEATITISKTFEVTPNKELQSGLSIEGAADVTADVIAANYEVGESVNATIKTNVGVDGNTSELADYDNTYVPDALKFTLHVGADSSYDNKISVEIDSMSAAGLGLLNSDGKLLVDGKDSTNADAAIDVIANAIQKVSTQRSALGAVQNRLEHTILNLDNVVENTTAAESQIRDTDMATEMVKYSNNNILAQAGQAMLAQANQANQGVLSLLG